MRAINHKLNQNLLLVKTFIDLLEQGGLSDLQESKDIAQAYKFLDDTIGDITGASSEALQRSRYDCTRGELRSAFGTITSKAAAIVFCGSASSVKDEKVKEDLINYYHDVINAKVAMYKDSLN
jgi:hypothetical protein